MPQKVKPKKKRAPPPSELLLSFAEPLLDLVKSEGGDLDQVREALEVASTIWNAVSIADQSPDVLADLQRYIDAQPGHQGDIARQLLEDRRTRFADSSFSFGKIVVDDDGHGGFRVRA